MLDFILKALVSGLVVATASEVARRTAGIGGLIASLPLVAILGMIWLWRDTGDLQRIGAYATGTFWFVLPSLPMFLLLPVLLKRGVNFWPALAGGCVLTMVLYGAMLMLAPRIGIRL